LRKKQSSQKRKKTKLPKEEENKTGKRVSKKKSPNNGIK